jgi:hypothetical protein
MIGRANNVVYAEFITVEQLVVPPAGIEDRDCAIRAAEQFRNTPEQGHAAALGKGAVAE